MGSFRSLVFIEPDGSVVSDTGATSDREPPYANISNRSYFQKAITSGASVIDVIIPVTNRRPTVVFVTPVTSPQGALTGVALASVQEEQFVGGWLDRTGIDQSATTVLDATMSVIAGASSGTALAADQLPNGDPTTPYVGHRGGEVFGVTTVLDNGWTVLTETDAAAPLAAFLGYSRVVNLTLIVCLMVAMASAILVSATVHRPLVRLAGMAAEVASGTLDLNARGTPIPLAPVEVKSLHRAFGEMARALYARQQQLEQSNRELDDAVREKTVLFREVQHRVRNNLATMEGLLALQRSQVPEDSPAYRALSNSEARVQSMAILHRQLLESESSETVDLAIYLDSLLLTLRKGHGRPGVEMEHRIASIVTDVSMATSCGLIVTELVINAYKYAFPAGTGGISVSAAINADGLLELAVRDNGRGVPDSEGPSDGLGLRLVRSLVQQIDGQLQIESADGTHIVVTAPLLNHR